MTAEHAITVEAARITLDSVEDVIRGDTLELTGSTNLAPGTDLLVTILPAAFEPTDKTQAEGFGGVTGMTRVVAGGGMDHTFRFAADTAGFRAGSYRASVEAVEADANATTTFEVVETITQTPTPTPTPMTPTPTPRTAPPIAPPAAAFSWEADGADPLTLQFTDASRGDVAARRWDFGDGDVSLEQRPFHSYPAPGDYTVTLTVTGPGGVSTAVRELAIRRTATPSVTPTTVPPTVTVATVTPTATGGDGGGEVPWWLAVVAGVGLLACGAALAKWWPSPPEVVENPVPGLTITPRGGVKRSDGAGEAPIEIEVRGGVRRER